MCSLIAKLAMLSAFAASLQLQDEMVTALEEQVVELRSAVDHLQKQQVIAEYYHVN